MQCFLCPKLPVLILFIVLFDIVAFSQDILDAGMPAPLQAMGNISTTQRNIFAVQGNQAGLGFLNQMELYASAENRFGQPGLNFYSLLAAYPSSWGGWGFSIQHFGLETYNETMVGLAYGKRLFENIALGVKFDYLSTRIPTYGKKSSYTAEIGVLSWIIPELWIGFHFFNPFEVVHNGEEVMPRIMKLGIGYDLTKRSTLAMEIEKPSYHPPNVKLAVEYYILEKLALRLGINSQPVLYSFGVGYRFGNGVRMDFGSAVHQMLGVSPSGGFGYSFQRK